VTLGRCVWSQFFILFLELLNIDAHEDYLQSKPNFIRFWFVVEEIWLWNVHFFSMWATKNFFGLRYFLLNFFLCVLNQVSKHIMSWPKLQDTPILQENFLKCNYSLPQTNKKILLSNFRIFSCKMDVSYNFRQLIICLETWLKTHKKKFNKKYLKPKKFLAARIEKKRTFLTISPQP
jgi:hypothetical protein